MPAFDYIDKVREALATAAVALAGAVSLRFAGWARSRERYDTIKSRLRIASIRADCQVLRMRQACAMGRLYHAHGAGMQNDEEEDQPALPP
eukprot:8712550-Alexandrium_andersonii.AAC.1